MSDNVKTTFKGPGEWLSQAHELEDESSEEVDDDDTPVLE